MRKLNARKYILRNINDNAVQGRLPENYLTRKIIARNILDTKYLRFTVEHAVWHKINGGHWLVDWCVLVCSCYFFYLFPCVEYLSSMDRLHCQWFKHNILQWFLHMDGFLYMHQENMPHMTSVILYALQFLPWVGLPAQDILLFCGDTKFVCLIFCLYTCVC